MIPPESRRSGLKCRCGCCWRGVCRWAVDRDGYRLVPALTADSEPCPRCGTRDAVVRVSTMGSRASDETFREGERVLDWNLYRDGLVPAGVVVRRAPAEQPKPKPVPQPQPVPAAAPGSAADVFRDLAVLTAALAAVEGGTVRRGTLLAGKAKKKKRRTRG
jgi:hypothetical protein